MTILQVFVMFLKNLVTILKYVEYLIIFGLIFNWKSSNRKICSQETWKFYFLVSGKCCQDSERRYKDSIKFELHSGKNEANIRTSSCCWCQFIPSVHKTCNFSLLHASKVSRCHLPGQAFCSKALVWSILDTLKQLFLNHMVRGNIFWVTP